MPSSSQLEGGGKPGAGEVGKGWGGGPLGVGSLVSGFHLGDPGERDRWLFSGATMLHLQAAISRKQNLCTHH